MRRSTNMFLSAAHFDGLVPKVVKVDTVPMTVLDGAVGGGVNFERQATRAPARPVRCEAAHPGRDGVGGGVRRRRALAHGASVRLAFTHGW